MTLKPPTRTSPKLVMKEWPTVRDLVDEGWGKPEKTVLRRQQEAWSRPLSDFTRVVEETGILDQQRSQKEKSR